MEKKQEKKERNRLGEILFTWFKFIIGLLLSGLIIYKLSISELIFDFSNFDFNALLALILSLFAIGLSVLFYFKATETSNLFYDNTYKFTKEISEILGRIEAGFGERLRHLDEGYSGLINKFDNSFNEMNINETKEEIVKEKEKLRIEKEERNQIINSLIKKANLEKGETEKILQQLKEKEIEIARQNHELNFLRNKLKDEENFNEIEDKFPGEVYHFLRKYIQDTEINPELLLKLTSSGINRRFKIDAEKFGRNRFVFLCNYRIISEDGSFTVLGIKALRKIGREILSNCGL